MWLLICFLEKLSLLPFHRDWEIETFSFILKNVFIGSWPLNNSRFHCEMLLHAQDTLLRTMSKMMAPKLRRKLNLEEKRKFAIENFLKQMLQEKGDQRPTVGKKPIMFIGV